MRVPFPEDFFEPEDFEPLFFALDVLRELEAPLLVDFRDPPDFVLLFFPVDLRDFVDFEELFFAPEDLRELADFDELFFDEVLREPPDFDELFFAPDDSPELEELLLPPDFVRPSSARCLFTVLAAISFARSVDRPCSFSLSLTCSYCRSSLLLHAFGISKPPCCRRARANGTPGEAKAEMLKS